MQSFQSQRKGLVKAQEGEGNSWTGIAVTACRDVLQGCHASPIASHVLLCTDIHAPRGCPQDGRLQPRELFRGPQGGMGFGGSPFLPKSEDPPQAAIEMMLPWSWQLLPSPLPLGESPALAFRQCFSIPCFHFRRWGKPEDTQMTFFPPSGFD